MRHLRLGRYGIFPGPEPDILAVYVVREPAFLLVCRPWVFGWPAGGIAEVETLAARLRQEGEDLARRSGCPVAPLILLFFIRRERSWRPIQEQILRHQVTPVSFWLAQWPTDLFWIQPPARSELPPLPPYPQRTWWSAPVEPSWWLERLRLIREADDHRRKEEARNLAWKALAYLKEVPARLLVDGPIVLAAAQETLPVLPTVLDRVSGRRYLFWVGFYIAAVCLDGCIVQPGLDVLTLDFVRHLLENQGRWTTRERRLILRGLEFLTQKSADVSLSPETPFGQFLTGLLEKILEDETWMDLAHESWRARLRLKYLAETLARGGYVFPQTWTRRWRRHELERDILESTSSGLMERLLYVPSTALWKALRWTVPYESQRRSLGWALYANEWAPALWDLAVLDETMLTALTDAALTRLKDRHPPSPQSLERLREAIRRKLQDPTLSPWSRKHLENALTRLMLPPEEDRKEVQEWEE